MNVLLLLVLCASTLAVSRFKKPFYDPENSEALFEEFIEKFEKQYGDEAEKQKRFEIFKAKLHHINKLNFDPTETATFGITHFTDLSPEEAKQFMGLDLTSFNYENAVNVSEIKPSDIPENFDWRDHKAVTPVKNQGACGSCWAFSTTGVIEGAYAIKHKQLLSFSEQQLLDCVKRTKGCESGNPILALKYVQSNGGIVGEKDYPYKAVKGSCHFRSNQVKAKVTNVKVYSLRGQDEESLRQILVKNGPLFIAIYGEYLLYHEGPGIITACPSDQKVDHAVLLVGYGTDPKTKTPYWIIKNSWGTKVGRGGYNYLARGINSCGLMNTIAASATVA